MSVALPQAFCDMMVELLGQDEAQELFLSLEAEAPTSIRTSVHKPHPIAWTSESQSVPWCEQGYYLRERPRFTGDAAFHSGLYYVQEASSMLLAEVQTLVGERPVVALDLCAAPGGKSTLLLDILPQGSVLLSNEVVHHRANILAENLLKWGNPNSIVTNAYPEVLAKLGATFDFILVDAPCSGEGMFRKDKEARNEWTAQSPTLCSDRQRAILADIWPTLRDDGLLVYSTCTMNKQENEEILAYIIEELGAESLALPEVKPGVWLSPFSPYSCYRMMPHRVAGEGLFLAVVRKKVTNEFHGKSRVTKNTIKDKAKPLLPPREVYSFIKDAEELSWEQIGDDVMAYPKQIIPLLHQIKSLRIPIITAGIPVAKIKGKSIVPHTAVALSTALKKESFEWIELNLEQCLSYLKREALHLEGEYTMGYKVVHYQGIPLGFIKYLGNRSNNLYPNEWRIRNL